jgi:phosphoglycolate phosphatase-like HAD superfamily hydrolase
LRIAIDIDSTLHDYWPGFAAAAKRRFGVELAYEDQITWEILQLRNEQVRAIVHETHRDDNVLAAEPYPGAVEAIRGWKAAGHWILVASHRIPEAHAATAGWLDRIGLPYDELYCGFDKVTHAVEAGVDVLIDDSPRTLARALEEGITVATLMHPWNRELCETEDVACASDWEDLAAKLEAVLA